MPQQPQVQQKPSVAPPTPTNQLQPHTTINIAPKLGPQTKIINALNLNLFRKAAAANNETINHTGTVSSRAPVIVTLNSDSMSSLSNSTDIHGNKLTLSPMKTVQLHHQTNNIAFGQKVF